ncbi:hypothetical protein ACEUBQ_17415 [Aeromonas veronii]
MSKPSLFDMLDQVRPDLEPLAPHFMADKELVEKERYLRKVRISGEILLG